MLQYYRFKEMNEMIMQGREEEARRILMELQAHYIALCDELRVLKNQVREFENIFFLSQNLIQDSGHYWLRTGSLRHGPFCKSCYDGAGKLIRLEEHASVRRCPYCGMLFGSRPAMQGDEAHAPLRRGNIIPFPISTKCC